MTQRHAWAILFGVFVALLASASLAWACTPQARITINPNEGEAGTRAVVKGHDFVRKGPVRIYWEPSNGSGRALLATVEGPDFVEPVTIPEDATPDVHYVKAYGYTPGNDGGVAVGDGSASFRVEPARSGDTDDGPGDSGPDTSGQPPASEDSSDGERSGSDGNASQGRQGANEARSGSGDGSSGPRENSPSPSDGSRTWNADAARRTGSSSQQSSSQPPASPDGAAPARASEPDREAVGGDAQSSVAEGERSRPASAAPGDATPDATSSDGDETRDTGSREQGRAPSSGPAHDDASRPGADEPQDSGGEHGASDAQSGRPDTDAAGQAPAVSARSGADDLWSGFVPGDDPALATGLDDPVEAVRADELGQQLAVAVALLAAGLVVLVGGLTVAGLRRRAVVRARPRHQPTRGLHPEDPRR